jgi:pyroglutamyl-peptidase
VIHVLVTGFEPFGGSPVNASEEAVSGLPAGVDGVRITTAVLPCVFGEAPRELDRLIGEHRPDVVIAVGEAGGRSSVDLERVAINVDDARIPDNAGESPVDVPVVDGAPPAYFSTLPIKAGAAAISTAGVPGSVSNSAGTFVCNHVFFALMHTVAGLEGVRAGFVHVPTIDVLAPREATRALEAVITATGRTTVDIAVTAGTEQ